MSRQTQQAMDEETRLLEGILEGLRALSYAQRKKFHDRIRATVEREEERLAERLIKKKRTTKTGIKRIKKLANDEIGYGASTILMRCALDPNKKHRRFMTSDQGILEKKEMVEKTLGIEVIDYAEEMGFESEPTIVRPDYIG